MNDLQQHIAGALRHAAQLRGGTLKVTPGNAEALAQRIAGHLRRQLGGQTLYVPMADPSKARPSAGADRWSAHTPPEGWAVRSAGVTHSAQPQGPAIKARVDAALRVYVAGRYWSVSKPGFCVGEMVWCWPVRSGAALFVRACHKGQPGIWASPLELSHSPWHTAPPLDTDTSWGSQTRVNAPERKRPSDAPGVPRSTQTPPPTTPSAYTHSRTSGTACAAPADCSTPIALGEEQGQAWYRSHKKDICKSQAPLQVSIRLEVVSAPLYRTPGNPGGRS